MENKVTDMAIADFYASNGGDKLVSAEYYPAKIKRFLQNELKFFREVLAVSSYECLLEVGCMCGRLLKLAKGFGLSYRGIDLVESFIVQGKALAEYYQYSELAFFWTRSVLEVDALLSAQRHLFPRQPNRLLAVMPFNCIGNVAEPEAALASLWNCGCDLLISTYTTDINAREMRLEYYQRCGYKNLEFAEDGRGVLFSSSEGFCSFAYHPHYLQSILERNGFSVTLVKFFNPCGVAYLVRLREKRLRNLFENPDF